MPTDWNDITNWQRLIAAVFATGVKIDTRATAKYFGTTYDSIETRLRPIKAKAAEMKAENGGEEIVAPRSTATKKKGTATVKSPAQKGSLNKVATGRVSKTPTKKSAATVKKDLTTDEDDESVMGNAGSSSDEDILASSGIGLDMDEEV